MLIKRLISFMDVDNLNVSEESSFTETKLFAIMSTQES